MTNEKIKKVLEDHKLWLSGESDGIRAVLSHADLSDADLSYADLSDADLSCANLSDANLSRAGLSGANLSGANLSGVKGLTSAINYLDANFEKTNDGFIVYKTFGGHYSPNKEWAIENGAVLSEVVNPNRTSACGCGINVAPIEWVRSNYKGEIWKCLIRWEWLAGVVVPYNTDGKIRCERLELIEIVEG